MYANMYPKNVCKHVSKMYAKYVCKHVSKFMPVFKIPSPLTFVYIWHTK